MLKTLHTLLLLTLFACIAHAQPASFDAAAARGTLTRLMPALAPQFTLVPIAKSGNTDRFRVTGTDGHIRVEGTSPTALLYGVNWYLKYTAHLQISPNGMQLQHHGPLPAPAKPIERSSLYPWRYALNQNTDGYTAPYWPAARWQHEVDIFALSGINALLVERGTDLVLYQTFRDFGYSDEEIRHWITQPAHQNWQLMGNMCCFDEPISAALMQKRAHSTQQLLAQLRALGITPVLPGYYGMVPADFATKHPGAHVIPQGEWNGFTRPGWLDPRDPQFAKLAESFYRHQHALFGDTSIYDLEVFQEGGGSGDVPVAAGAHAIQQSLDRAHPGAYWMLLGWQKNPTQELLDGVDRPRFLVADIEQARIPRDNRSAELRGAPWLFGGLFEFGGRTTFGANLYDYAIRLPKLGTLPHSTMAGTAYFPEGIDTNPIMFDLFTEMAWRRDPVNLPSWTHDYVTRRYGSDDPRAQQAWQILLSTAYGNRADGEKGHGERDAAQDSLFNAQPNLKTKHDGTWSPDIIRYDPAKFAQALPLLLAASPAVRATATYQYDVVDVARQVMANESRALLPQIDKAYEAKDRAAFHKLTQRWLSLMDLQDELLATNRFFLLGNWLAPVQAWSSSPAESVLLNYDARSILTTWGNRKASEDGLHEYGNKDWAGLTRDYYKPRWQLYFAALDRAMTEHQEPRAIDWYAFGDTWNRERKSYSAEPHGDPYAVAERVARELGLHSATERKTPIQTFQ